MRSIVSDLALAIGATAAITCTASAEWFAGQPIEVNGSVDLLEEPPAKWGTWAGQGLHILGENSQYVAPVFGGALIGVRSEVLDPHAISLTLDLSDFPFIEIGTLFMTLPNMKAPPTQLFVQSSAGNASFDGQSLYFNIPTGDVPAEIKLLIVQVPAPASFVLLGASAFVSRRRRD